MGVQSLPGVQLCRAALLGHDAARQHHHLIRTGYGAHPVGDDEDGLVFYAPIILLDEATASLDVENETAIQEALSRLIKNKTVLIIAHRMRTVAGADQLVVLSGGIVVEQGSPAELYARKGLYTHMVDLQSASQNWTI